PRVAAALFGSSFHDREWSGLAGCAWPSRSRSANTRLVWYISGTHNGMGAVMGLRGQRPAFFGLVIAALVVAGCGNSIHLTGSVPPPPGHQAPANAVSGLVKHLLAGGNPVTACSYVDPGEEGNC